MGQVFRSETTTGFLVRVHIHALPSGAKNPEDMKTTSKILSAILLFRQAPYSGWTNELDTKMRSWSKRFINWLETHPFGKDEGSTPKYAPFFPDALVTPDLSSNHGTYFYNVRLSS